MPIKLLFLNKLIKIKKYKLKILNLITPISLLLSRFFYKKYWCSNLSKKNLRSWQNKNNLYEQLSDWYSSIHQPQNWRKSLLLVISIVFAPQIIILIWYFLISRTTNNLNFIENDQILLLETAWEVIAGLIGITFVIVIFVIDYANRDKYGKVALPVFFTETQLLFSASFGIMVIVSIGIYLFLYYQASNITEIFDWLYVWQWLLFLINALLIIIIFIRTLRILSRRYFQGQLRDYIDRASKKIVASELVNRISTKQTEDYLKTFGIKISYFPPNKSHGKYTVTIKNLDKKINKVIDLNLKFIEIAYKNAKSIIPDLKIDDFNIFVRVGKNLSCEEPGIALINPILDQPCITSYLENSIKLQKTKGEDNLWLDELLEINNDMIINAVNNQEIVAVEEGLNQYKYLLESFLKNIEFYGMLV